MFEFYSDPKILLKLFDKLMDLKFFIKSKNKNKELKKKE
jgi:hypothetical protein